MSKNIELQEEFEALIGELERLKTVNEITKENSENAERTIEEINSFVVSTQTLKQTIEEDYRSKMIDLENAKNSLVEELNLLRERVDRSQEEYENLAQKFDGSTHKTLKSIETELKKAINEYIKEVNKLKNDLSIDFTRFNQTAIKEIKDSSVKTLDVAKENQKKVNKELELFKEDTSEQFLLVNKKMTEYHNSILEQLKTQNAQLKFMTWTLLIIFIGALGFGFLLYNFI